MKGLPGRTTSQASHCISEVKSPAGRPATSATWAKFPLRCTGVRNTRACVMAMNNIQNKNYKKGIGLFIDLCSPTLHTTVKILCPVFNTLRVVPSETLLHSREKVSAGGACSYYTFLTSRYFLVVPDQSESGGQVLPLLMTPVAGGPNLVHSRPPDSPRPTPNTGPAHMHTWRGLGAPGATTTHGASPGQTPAGSGAG